MERPEAQDAGTIILTGFDLNTVLDSINLVISEQVQLKKQLFPLEYSVENTSWRVLKLIMGTAKLSNKWDNIVKE